MSKRMSNTLRRIYKQNNVLCEQNTPVSPTVLMKSNLYAELNDDTQEARSIVGAPSKKNMVSISPKLSCQKKIRHRRLGSADSNYTFVMPSKQLDRRNIQMVHMETQTDNVHHNNNGDDEDDEDDDVDDDGDVVDNKSISNSTIPTETQVLQNIRNFESPETGTNNGNEDEVQQFSNEQLIFDYMNSNEQLDVRESSDEDNLENLNRRVSQFFTQNRLLQSTENGNASLAFISINEKDGVTVLSRGNNFRTGGVVNTTVYTANSNVDSFRRDNLNYNNNNPTDDGDDSWTDEEGDESDRSYSLRRKRLVLINNIKKTILLICSMIILNFNKTYQE